VAQDFDNTLIHTLPETFSQLVGVFVGSSTIYQS